MFLLARWNAAVLSGGQIWIHSSNKKTPHLKPHPTCKRPETGIHLKNTKKNAMGRYVQRPFFGGSTAEHPFPSYVGVKIWGFHGCWPMTICNEIVQFRCQEKITTGRRPPSLGTAAFFLFNTAPASHSKSQQIWCWGATASLGGFDHEISELFLEFLKNGNPNVSPNRWYATINCFFPGHKNLAKIRDDMLLRRQKPIWGALFCNVSRYPFVRRCFSGHARTKWCLAFKSQDPLVISSMAGWKSRMAGSMMLPANETSIYRGFPSHVFYDTEGYHNSHG